MAKPYRRTIFDQMNIAASVKDREDATGRALWHLLAPMIVSETQRINALPRDQRPATIKQFIEQIADAINAKLDHHAKDDARLIVREAVYSMAPAQLCSPESPLPESLQPSQS